MPRGRGSASTDRLTLRVTVPAQSDGSDGDSLEKILRDHGADGAVEICMKSDVGPLPRDVVEGEVNDGLAAGGGLPNEAQDQVGQLWIGIGGRGSPDQIHLRLGQWPPLI